MNDFNGVYIEEEYIGYDSLKEDMREGYHWIVRARPDTGLKLYLYDFNLAIL